MSHQDFERYAEEKPFGADMPAPWARVFRDVARGFDCGPAGLMVLDVGCGDGRIFPFLLGEGLAAHNIYGVEVSRARIDRCQALGWFNAVPIADGASLPFANEQFHIVNFMEVIEHIPETKAQAVIAELHRVLRKDGALLITTPNYPIKRFYDIHAAVAHGKKDRWRDDSTHVTRYNHARLSRLLSTFFGKVEPRTFKEGFIYKYLPHHVFKHKIFFVCSEKRQ